MGNNNVSKMSEHVKLTLKALTMLMYEKRGIRSFTVTHYWHVFTIKTGTRRYNWGAILVQGRRAALAYVQCQTSVFVSKSERTRPGIHSIMSNKSCRQFYNFMLSLWSYYFLYFLTSRLVIYYCSLIKYWIWQLRLNYNIGLLLYDRFM